MPDLVYTLESADDQSLEVELVGDPQIERHVQRVVNRGERTSCRASVQRLQNRSFHFEKIALIKKGADRTGHAGAGDEERPDFRVHGQIGVTLPVPLLGVGEPGVTHELSIHFFFLPERQRTKRFRQ